MDTKKRLLVVEDDPDLLDIYRIGLARAGYEVICATDGEDALKKFLAFHPQVVVCDIKLPKLAGFDVIAIIKQHTEITQQPAIIVMSAYGDKLMRQKAARLGIAAQNYLVKSQVTLNEALQTIQNAFQVAKLEPVAV